MARSSTKRRAPAPRSSLMQGTTGYNIASIGGGGDFSSLREVRDQEEEEEEQLEKERQERVLWLARRTRLEQSVALIIDRRRVMGTGVFVRIAGIDCVVACQSLLPTPSAAQACRLRKASSVSRNNSKLLPQQNEKDRRVTLVAVPSALFEVLQDVKLVACAVKGLDVVPAPLAQSNVAQYGEFLHLLTCAGGDSLRLMEVGAEGGRGDANDDDDDNDDVLWLADERNQFIPSKGDFFGSPIFSITNEDNTSGFVAVYYDTNKALKVESLVRTLLQQRRKKVPLTNRALLAIMHDNAANLECELAGIQPCDIELRKGLTLQRLAAMMGAEDCLRFLQGTIPEDDISSLAGIAAYHGHVSILDLIEQSGGKINAKDAAGWEPMDFAALAANANALRWYSKRGFSMKRANSIADKMAFEVQSTIKNACSPRPESRERPKHGNDGADARKGSEGSCSTEHLDQEVTQGSKNTKGEPPLDLQQGSIKYIKGEISAEDILQIMVRTYGDASVRGSAWSKVCSSVLSAAKTTEERNQYLRDLNQEREVYIRVGKERQKKLRDEAKRRREAKALEDAAESAAGQGQHTSLRETLKMYVQNLIGAHDFHVHLLDVFGVSSISGALHRISKTLSEDKRKELLEAHLAWKKREKKEKDDAKRCAQEDAQRKQRETLSSDLDGAVDGKLSTGIALFCSEKIDATNFLADYLRPLFGSQLSNALPSILRSLPNNKRLELGSVTSAELSKRYATKRVAATADIYSTSVNPFISTQVTGWTDQEQESKGLAEQNQDTCIETSSNDQTAAVIKPKRSATDDLWKAYLKVCQKCVHAPPSEFYSRLEGVAGEEELVRRLPTLLQVIPEEVASSLSSYIKAKLPPGANHNSLAVAEEEHEQGEEIDHHYVLTAEESAAHLAQFQDLDKDSSGRISGEDAKSIFAKSGLSDGDLARVWSIADHSKCGTLDCQQFIHASHLIDCALHKGLPVPTHLPAVVGGDLLVRAPVVEAQWIISLESRTKYKEEFQRAIYRAAATTKKRSEQAGTPSLLPGRHAHKILSKILSDADELAACWAFAGIVGLPKIGPTSWLLLAHAVNQVAKNGLPLPRHLPKCLKHFAAQGARENAISTTSTTTADKKGDLAKKSSRGLASAAEAYAKSRMTVEELYFDCILPAAGSKLSSATHTISNALPRKQKKAFDKFIAQQVAEGRKLRATARKDPVIGYSASLITADGLLDIFYKEESGKKAVARRIEEASGRLPNAKAKILQEAFEARRGARRHRRAVQEIDQEQEWDFQTNSQIIEATKAVQQNDDGDKVVEGSEDKEQEEDEEDRENMSEASLWIMALSDRALYDKTFQQLDKDGSGCISHSEMQRVYIKAQIPEADAAHLWNLAFAISSETSGLDKAAFAVAYHMIRVIRHHEGELKVPKNLPKELVFGRIS